MKFVISILSLNRLELTERCINSVIANSTASSYHLILTDNGSVDGSREYVERFRGSATVVLNDKNEGFIGPNNKAFERAKEMGAEYFIALNNDCEVPEGWLEKLAAPLDADPKGALSGPEGGCRTLHENMDGYPGERLDYIEGSCLCAKISIVSTQGPLFSPYLDFIYGDDSDLSLRMREAGYNIYQAPFRVKHVQSATTLDPSVRDRCRQAQQRNHKTGMKRWSFYLKHRHFNYPLIFCRRHAVGDVLLTTPIIAMLKAQNPERPIWVETDFPDIFKNNPHVEKAEKRLAGVFQFAPCIDLNGAYEVEIEKHIITCYAEKSKVACLRNPKLYPSPDDILWAKNLAKSEQFSDKVCVMHADGSAWPGKRWPVERFSQVAQWLVNQGWHVVAVGNTPLPDKFPAFNLIGLTCVLQLAALMATSQLFIGGDSFPMHAALAMGCPTVGVFGVTSSKFIVHGSGKQIHLDAPASIPCAGLRHRTLNSERVDCDPVCINSHNVFDVQIAINKLGVL